MGAYFENPRGISAFLAEQVRPAVDKIAHDILDESLRLVPRDTESLANSGRVEHEADSDDWQIAYGGPDYAYTGPGGGTVDYAKYVEYGHRTTASPPTYVAPRPFLRPAALHER